VVVEQAAIPRLSWQTMTISSDVCASQPSRRAELDLRWHQGPRTTTENEPMALATSVASVRFAMEQHHSQVLAFHDV
jgi:hypothetical protein